MAIKNKTKNKTKNIILSLVTVLSFSIVAILLYQYENFLGKKDAKKSVVALKPKALGYEGSLLIPEIDLDNLLDLVDELQMNPSAAGDTFDLQTMAATITQEALNAFSNTNTYALPLLAHWNTGIPESIEAMDPMYMFERIELGEHILVSWKLDSYYDENIALSYYET